MDPAESLGVEIVYALPERQHIIRVKVPAGTLVADAIRQSGILNEHPEIDLARAKLGIFSRRVDPDSPVRAGDRIEIYRPLIADPKAVRRQRANARKNERPPRHPIERRAADGD
jgi:putative ubiquitin-RnfH superfamily antitoxin RatB of RatAB toxin-antitoxin module